MLASRSATASESSANAGSNALSGNAAAASSYPYAPPAARCADSRNDDRDVGRSGVVGRVRERDRERERERVRFVLVSSFAAIFREGARVRWLVFLLY